MFFLSQAYSSCNQFCYPIIADPGRDIASLLGMLDPEEKDKAGLPLTCRAVSDLTTVCIRWFVGYKCGDIL